LVLTELKGNNKGIDVKKTKFGQENTQKRAFLTKMGVLECFFPQETRAKQGKCVLKLFFS
jgi:hypothetical protein